MNIQVPESAKTSSRRKMEFPGAPGNSRGRLIRAGIVAFVVLVLALLIYRALAPEPEHPEPPAPVHVSQPVRKTMIVSEHTDGTVIANATVSVTARVSGEMVKAFFKEGDIVHKGDLLFQLDPRPLQAAVQQAEATMKRDEATLVSNRRDAARFTTLAKAGAVSAQQRDQAVAAAGAMAATVAADKAALQTAKLNLVYAQIRSPIDGKTGAIMVQPGNLVTADSATPLVVITQVQPVKVSFTLPQTDLPRIQAQMRAHRMIATVRVNGAGGETLRAPVDFVGNQVDNKSGTIELRATFPNKDLALVPGALVDTRVTLNTIRDALVIPHDAVNPGPDGNYVWVIGPDMKAHLRHVDIVYDDGEQTAIKGNVKLGDKLVTTGQVRLEEGKEVTIQTTQAPPTVETPEGAQ